MNNLDQNEYLKFWNCWKFFDPKLCFFQPTQKSKLDFWPLAPFVLMIFSSQNFRNIIISVFRLKYEAWRSYFEKKPTYANDKTLITFYSHPFFTNFFSWIDSKFDALSFKAIKNVKNGWEWKVTKNCHFLKYDPFPALNFTGIFLVPQFYPYRRIFSSHLETSK